MSALVVTAENNLKYVATQSGTEILISGDHEFIAAVADQSGRIWALVDEEPDGSGDTGHAYVIYYCASPGANATFTRIPGSIHASALAPSAVQNKCYYLDADGNVYLTDTSGKITTIYSNFEGTGYSPTAIAYSSASHSDYGTIFLIGSQAYSYNPTYQNSMNDVYYWSELYPGSSPTKLTETSYNAMKIAGAGATEVWVLDEIQNVFTLNTKNKTGTSSSNTQGTFGIGGANSSSVGMYAISGESYNAGSPTNPNFTGGNVLIELDQDNSTWIAVKTSEGVIRVSQGYDNN